MNMNPDETKLALWLDDELKDAELAEFESSLANHPEHFAAREDIRRWRQTISAAMPMSEEPPYADFFNSRISRTIRETSLETPVAKSKSRFSWRSFLMPVAACAGMVLAFMGGMKSKSGPPEIDVAGAPKAIPVDPILYTPDIAVKAEWFASSDASATVIVLDGVDAIPDAIDFSETAAVPLEREIDATAEHREEKADPLGL
jgi:hypothetical protein